VKIDGKFRILKYLLFDISLNVCVYTKFTDIFIITYQ